MSEILHSFAAQIENANEGIVNIPLRIRLTSNGEGRSWVGGVKSYYITRLLIPTYFPMLSPILQKTLYSQIAGFGNDGHGKAPKRRFYSVRQQVRSKVN